MTAFEFTEQQDYEEGFSKVYDEQIAPFLQNFEEKRLSVQERRKRWITLVGVVTAFITWQASKLHPVAMIHPIFFGGGFMLYLYLTRFEKLGNELTDFIRPIICNFFDDMTYSDLHPGSDFSIKRLRDLNIIPRADREKYGVSIAGSWRDTAYRMTEARFANERRDHNDKKRLVTVFSGVILEIECPVNMPTIVFLPDYGKTMNAFMGWAARNNRPPHQLHFPDKAVEEVFEVFTDDLEKAQGYLNPEFGNMLLQIAQKYQTSSKKHISAAFQGDKFYLAINLPHAFMNLDVTSRALNECNDKIHQAMADLVIPREIIDHFHQSEIG